MKRGYPARAARTLEVAPQTDEVKLLRGWVLVKAGDSVNAEHWLNNIGQGVSGSWALMSVMAMCKFRLGRLDECRDLAEKIPMNLGIWSAHAAYALASYHLRIGNYEKSLDWYYNSRDLYYSSGEISSAIQCGGMISTLICKKGEDPRLAFADVLVDSENVLLERASILVNYADCLSEYLGYHDFEQFESIYKEAIQIFRQNENSDGEASALNSCGVCAHFGERFEYALKYYKMALKCVESTGNIRLLGIISANLAEVMGDADRIKGVIDFLSRSGHGEIAEQIGNNLL
ncbi:lipopolysaccharide assembly protein LapB [Deinococcus sp. JMULE3]|uniref:tetratricopeptide repeat protein n=1 Tax=Deinococcus sp. JMULE3 TaxID=2518341 RepID=UPI0015769710|nr:tetratricopeptide repeat protein [Deinococcus sp. JMULE3]NTY01797.1 tetratricopeptide repeat protein [Deinococcus sp. JMULE3]